MSVTPTPPFLGAAFFPELFPFGTTLDADGDDVLVCGSWFPARFRTELSEDMARFCWFDT
jgi:hypothetical protein